MVVQKISHPTLSATNLSWADSPRYWALNSSVLDKVPAVLILRNTRFSGNGGSIQTGSRYLYRDAPLQSMVRTAYGVYGVRAIFPDDMPKEHYDVMLTLPAHGLEKLQAILKNNFGLTAHHEKRNAEVFYLRVANENAPGIKISKGGNQYWSGMSSASFTEETITNIPFSNMLGFIEENLNKPTIDQTGFKGKYEVHLKWPRSGSNTPEQEVEAFRQAMLDQLGIEAVPGNEPTDMLIVEKTP
jgi:uncharacterized protein (TIGR03435 family)